MWQAGGYQVTIEKLYALYEKKGFLREEEALAIMAADSVSLVGVSRITDRLVALGVIFANDSDAYYDEGNDRAQTDYEALYTEILEISPGQRILIHYIRNVRPPQYREWQSLVTQMNSGNEYALSRLLDMYLRVVARIALRFYKDKSLELDDVIQEGAIGLIRAIRQYDYGMHNNLGSYLSVGIQQSIARAVADKSRIIRLPVYAYEIVQKLTKAQQALQETTEKEISCSEIAVEEGISEETAIKLLEMAQEPISLDELLNNEENGEIIYKYLTVPSFEKELETNNLIELTHNVLATLTDKERRVLSLRYGLYDNRERTLEEVGVIFNLTRERVRQIEAKTFKKIRHLKISRIIKSLI